MVVVMVMMMMMVMMMTMMMMMMMMMMVLVMMVLVMMVMMVMMMMMMVMMVVVDGCYILLACNDNAYNPAFEENLTRLILNFLVRKNIMVISYPRRFRKTMRSWKFMSASLQINPCAAKESTNLFIHSCRRTSIWCRTFRRVFLMVFVETWTVSQLRMWFYVRQRRLSKTLLLSACRLSRHPYDNKCVLWCLFGGAERSNSRTFYSILLTLKQQNWFTRKTNNRRFSKIWFR